MAGSPILKVYSPAGEYVGSAKEVIGASVMAQAYGDGSTIRLGHKVILWTQGFANDGDACESYDHTGEVMVSRAGHFHERIIY
jgi:hypothetical protein